MRKRFFRDDVGQMLLWIALAMPLLILFTGMAVDMGVIYMTKARLANAADAAVLTGVKTVPYWTSKEGSQSAGQADSQRYASEMFIGNFGSTTPTQTYTWCPGDPSCPPNTVSLKLHATTVVDTAFIRYLPQWAQWTVGATSQATRGNLVMSLVLDRSGSMDDNGGMSALKGAVPSFVQDFAEGVDHVAMISYASNSRVDVAVSQRFTTPIKNAVSALVPDGATFGTGAGTNVGWSTTSGPPLSMADNQNNSVTFPQGSAVVKAVVYFTDGLMNTIQDNFNCPGQALLNYGGFDENQHTSAIDSFNPLSENDIYGCFDFNSGCSNHDGINYNAHHDVCTNGSGKVKKFPSQKHGMDRPINRANVTEEAQYRAIYTANQMRRENPIPTYVYVIGLGQDIAGDDCTSAFLSTLANDPGGTRYHCPANPAVYDASLPPGLFLQVPNCPSPTCTQTLSQAFQTIASRILLRLSQ